MTNGGGEGRAALLRVGRTLGRRRQGRKPFASMVFMTDPLRTPDPLRAAERLPHGAAVIYRTFGTPDALAVALKLRRLTRARGLLLLIGADAGLARLCDADGVHLPECMANHLLRLRAQRPRWILTTAAHSARALHRAEQAGADAVLLSAVFASGSASATTPIGPVRLAQMVRGARTSVLALGGVNARTAPRLIGTGVAGFAAVDAWTR